MGPAPGSGICGTGVASAPSGPQGPLHTGSPLQLGRDGQELQDAVGGWWPRAHTPQDVLVPFKHGIKQLWVFSQPLSLRFTFLYKTNLTEALECLYM